MRLGRGDAAGVLLRDDEPDGVRRTVDDELDGVRRTVDDAETVRFIVGGALLGHISETSGAWLRADSATGRSAPALLCHCGGPCL